MTDNHRLEERGKPLKDHPRPPFTENRELEETEMNDPAAKLRDIKQPAS